MSSSVHNVIIKIRDDATEKIKAMSKTISGQMDAMVRKIEDNKEGIQAVGTAAGIMFAGLSAGIYKAVGESSKLENSLMGLQSIVEGTGGNFDEAKKKVIAFTQDGLLSVSEASTALKNLLARGYNQDEALTIMTRIKDAAAYGRQAGLDLGEAVVTATEGLKNENSVLVDNAGIQKNVAKMWEDYAKSIGKSTKDLTDAEKRQAEYNGIMEETKFQVGDAVKVSQTFAGTLLRVKAGMSSMFASIGDTVKPVLNDFLLSIELIIAKTTEWIQTNPELAGKIAMVATAITGLVAGASGLALALGPMVQGFTLVKNIAGGLIGPFLKIGNVILEFQGGFMGVFSKIGGILSGLVSPIGLVVGAIVAFGVAYTTNFMGFKDLVDGVVGFVWGKIQEFVSWIVSVWQESGLLENVSVLWENIKNIFVEVFGFFASLVSGALQGISNFWTEWGDVIVEICSNLWELVKNIFTIALESIISVIDGALGVINGIIDVFAGIFSGNWSQVWEGAKKIVSSIFGAIGGIVNAIVSGVLNFIDSVFGTNLRESWSKIWNGIVDFIKNIFNGNLLKAAGDAFGNIVNKAREWGANMIQMFIDGVKQKWNDFKNWVSETAGVLADFFGFHSPTKEGPNSDSDKWMPNFIKMMTKGLKDGQGDIRESVEGLASEFARVNKGLKVEDIMRAFDELEKDVERAFNNIVSEAERSAKKIEKFKNEIEKITDKIKDLRNSQKEDNESARMKVAMRAIEIEKEIADIQKKKKKDGDDLIKINSLERERQLAMASITREEYSLALTESKKSETQKILDKMQEKNEKYNQEILKQEELLTKKQEALQKEEESYRKLMDTKKALENEYFAIFKKNIKETQDEISTAISMLRRLHKMQGRDSSYTSNNSLFGPAFGGARASGGPVSAGSRYMVGERGPELFVPSTNGYIVPNNQLGGATININMGGVVVQNEADENRLVEKIKSTMYREMRLAKLGF